MLGFLFKNARVTVGRKLSDLEADLSPVGGFTGRGEIEYSSWQSGSKFLEVELRNVAGRTADVFINNERVKTVELHNGRVDQTFETDQGDAIPTLEVGAEVEIRQNGQPILVGVLRHD